ncbi:cam-binding protein 60-like G [Artemisia annua]|uniref:Cam-binding protein 60-like G n=1 Tax=Artemisia annua TaxID=35608 RepID=A0A2U1MUR7_ARTAN|nr:cam-binding protein 60-like G [Artemisia annua]
MVIKRPFGDGEEDGFRVAHQESKRRITTSNINAQNMMCGLSSQDLAATLEPLIRRWVREEVQSSCQRFFGTLTRSPMNAIEPCKKTPLQLRFVAKLPNTIFTSTQIRSEDNTAVKLVLFDVDSNEIVSFGPFSSMKVEIIPLDGDFSYDDDEDWPEKDFDDKVICARDGRRPLLTGDLVVTLENGVADLGELCFTDNSSWRRSRKFMIGARVKDTSHGVRIREARSQAVIVKDQRGEAYKKHHPPYLVDEIWRLEKIAKDGVIDKRLATYRICTVKDLLQMYATNQSLLRKLLGGSSNKTWETVIKHAKDCVLDDKLYMYRSSEDGIGLLLDSVLTVVGASFDGQNYQPLDKLSVYQMPMVEALKQKVYENLNGMVPIDESSVFGVPVPMSFLHQDHLKSEDVDFQGVNIPLLQQDEHETNMYGVVDSGSETEIGVGNDPGSIDYFSSALRNSFVFKECSSGGYGQDDLVADIGTSLWHGNELFIDTSNRTIDFVSSDFGISFSRNGSPRARWCKIRAALKWKSVRRDVAAKRMAEYESYFNF